MRNGFTLIEMAIVVIIVSLLVAGILQGQEIIKQSRINNTISKINSYNAAVLTFLGKYNELPGDTTRASRFNLNVPKGSSTPNVCATDATAVTATAGGNGNGDKRLRGTSAACNQSSAALLSNNAWNMNFSGEVANFFVHLSNAQLIRDSFSQPSTLQEAGTTFPSTSVGTGMVAVPDNAGGTYWVLGTGATLPDMTNAFAYGRSLTPAEGYAIDVKLDDGKPTTGAIASISNYSGHGVWNDIFQMDTTTSATTCIGADGSYNMSGTYETKYLCTLRILASF